MWTANHAYILQARAWDAGNNLSTATFNVTFKNDVWQPQSNFIAPVGGMFYNINNMSTITGTAVDPGANPSGVAGVGISIYNVNNGYWDQATNGWMGSQIWNPATYSNGNWTINISTSPWIDGQSFKIVSRALDNVVNIQQYEGNGQGNAGITIAIDNKPPIVNIQMPQNNTYYQALPTISGTSVDQGLAGVQQVQIAVQQVGGFYWSGSDKAFDSLTEVWTTVSGTSPWVYTAIGDNNKWISGGTYDVYAVGEDNAGNISSPTTSWFRID